MGKGEEEEEPHPHTDVTARGRQPASQQPEVVIALPPPLTVFTTARGTVLFRGQRQQTPAFRRQQTPAFRRQQTPAFRRQQTPAFRRQQTPAFRRQQTPAFRRHHLGARAGELVWPTDPILQAAPSWGQSGGTSVANRPHPSGGTILGPERGN
ncbi:hypothetical protein ACOMHN_002430 [Nucella lapillus]